jgi:phage shock protein A
MALVTRLSRLFRADLHAVLDRIEEPDLVLRQAVREMEEALAVDERRLRLLGHEREQLAAAATDLDRTLARIEEELDACFAAGRDELARTLIRRRLESERARQSVVRRIETLDGHRDTLGARIEEQRTQLEAMRQKAELLAGQETAEAPGGGPALDPAACTVRDEEVEVAFLREQQRRQGS